MGRLSFSRRTRPRTASTAEARSLRRDVALLIEPGRRWRWAVLVAFAVVGAGLEAVAALLVFFVTNRIAGGDASTMLDGLFAALGADDSLATAGAVIAVFFVLRGLFMVGSKWFEARTIQLTAARLSDRLFRRYVTAPYREHLRRNTAELMRNTIGSVDTVTSRYLTPIVTILGEAVVILLLVGVLTVSAPMITAVVAVVLTLVGFVMLRVVRRRMKEYGRMSESASGASLAVMQESLQDLRSIRLFGRERYFAALLHRQRRHFARSRYSLATLSTIPRVGIETLVFVLLAAFLAFSTVEAVSGSFGVIGLFAYAALRMLPGVNRIISGTNLMRFGSAAVGNVIGDLHGPEPPLPDRSRPDRPLPWRTLSFRNVGFSYDRGKPAVRSVNLTIRTGETLGVVGQTGSGKSTFIDLLLGLLEPSEGRIELDGVPLDDVVDDWQRTIGIVAQDVYLLDDTIRRNVAFGVPVGEIDDDLVWESLRMAQLDGFVAASPEGLHTPAGERGISVSGGERQRVAIARALYRRPRLLVLDEATSALDTATERDVMDEIRSTGADRTVVMVAHRLSSVKLCDRIVVFDRGRIVDAGTYDELADRNEIFGELVRAAG